MAKEASIVLIVENGPADLRFLVSNPLTTGNLSKHTNVIHQVALSHTHRRFAQNLIHILKDACDVNFHVGLETFWSRGELVLSNEEVEMSC